LAACLVRVWGSLCIQPAQGLPSDRTMELLEHRNGRDVGGEFLNSSLELRVSDPPKVVDTRRCGSQGQTGGLIVDLIPERPQGEGMEQGQAGPTELFEEQAASVVVAEAARCHIKITTQRSIHLRIANHTTRDIYVRLDLFSEYMNILSLFSSPCASMLPTPVEDSQGGVNQLFSSSVQSPARFLRELHADPDIQAQLEAEKEREGTYECTRLGTRSGMSEVLSSSLHLLSSNERVNTWVLGIARFVAVLMGVLLITVPTLLLLLESDIDVSFLHEIRQTPEFEQFHYDYYCPLRRWILCKISMVMENLWSD
ncbi:hypothetical protein XENOCAPTIV_007992, partial [Xenoophorus captivus]